MRSHILNKLSQFSSVKCCPGEGSPELHNSETLQRHAFGKNIWQKKRLPKTYEICDKSAERTTFWSKGVCFGSTAVFFSKEAQHHTFG